MCSSGFGIWFVITRSPPRGAFFLLQADAPTTPPCTTLFRLFVQAAILCSRCRIASTMCVWGSRPRWHCALCRGARGDSAVVFLSVVAGGLCGRSYARRAEGPPLVAEGRHAETRRSAADCANVGRAPAPDVLVVGACCWRLLLRKQGVLDIGHLGQRAGMQS